MWIYGFVGIVEAEKSNSLMKWVVKEERESERDREVEEIKTINSNISQQDITTQKQVTLRSRHGRWSSQVSEDRGILGTGTLKLLSMKLLKREKNIFMDTLIKTIKR